MWEYLIQLVYDEWLVLPQCGHGGSANAPNPVSNCGFHVVQGEFFQLGTYSSSSDNSLVGRWVVECLQHWKSNTHIEHWSCNKYFEVVEVVFCRSLVLVSLVVNSCSYASSILACLPASSCVWTEVTCASAERSRKSGVAQTGEKWIKCVWLFF